MSHFLSNPSSTDLKKYLKGFFGALLMGDESENMNSKFYFFSADVKKAPLPCTEFLMPLIEKVSAQQNLRDVFTV